VAGGGGLGLYPPPTVASNSPARAQPLARLALHTSRASKMPKVPAQPQGKRWCFTIHCNGMDGVTAQVLLDAMEAPEWGVYGGGQVERAPTTGALHLQGFCVFPTNKRLSALKQLHNTAHWELMRGTLEQSEAYCSKVDTREPGTHPRNWGDRPVTVGQGRRTDLATAVEALRAATGGLGERLRAAAAAAPEAYVKFHRGLEALAKVEAPVPVYNWPAPRVWQFALLEALAAPADDRHIMWFTDVQGAAGKSTFVRKYLSDHPAGAIVLHGKLADMAHAYNGERVVFFDVSRTQAEHMDHLYSFAESLKNGVFFSGKYEGGMKTFPAPHVVFFANQDPEMNKWSADRLVYKKLEAPDWAVVVPAPELPPLMGAPLELVPEPWGDGYIVDDGVVHAIPGAHPVAAQVPLPYTLVDLSQDDEY